MITVLRKRVQLSPHARNESEASSQSHEQYQIKNSILHSYWKHACGLSWLGFSVYQVAVEFDKHYNSKPLCRYSDESYPERYWYISVGVFAGFIFVLLLLVSKILLCSTAGERVSYWIALNITSMATISSTLTLFFNWGGICIDSLGVANSASLWGEWLFSGPLIVFAALAFVDKMHLSYMDVCFILTFECSLIFGFVITPAQSFGLGVMWLTLSFLAFLPILYLPCYVLNDNSSRNITARHDSADIESQLLKTTSASEIALFVSLQIKRCHASKFLTGSLLMYPVNYMLGMFDIVGYSDTIAVYQILALVLKGFLVYIIMDINADAHKEYQKLLLEEKRVNCARQNFLKYIFHEVRTPLNSLTIGVDLLSYSENLTDDDREAVSMMHNASSIMNDTLNGVLNMQKIEEGEFELDLSPFVMSDCIMKAFQTFRRAAKAKHIHLIKNIASDIPHELIGDGFRIEHVIGNLLSNAIKFSPDHSSIHINVSCVQAEQIQGKAKRVSVTVSIVDQGPGISETEQKQLFNNFSQTRPKQLQQGQGSGLGLSLCKNIVTLHGGSINVISQVGQGSNFSFTIPFDILEKAPSRRSITGSRCGFFHQEPSQASFFASTFSSKFLGSSKIAPIPSISEKAYQTISHNDSLKSVHMRRHGSFDGIPIYNTDDSSKTVSMSKHDSLRDECMSGHSSPKRVIMSLLASSAKNAPREPPPVTSMIARKSVEILDEENMIVSIKSTRGCRNNLISSNSSSNSLTSLNSSSNNELVALVVDDVMSNRKMLSMLLRKRGVPSELAHDGANAIDIIKNDPHAHKLILMDNLMPVMNGVDAARQLRQSGYPYLIIGVTGNVMKDDICEYIEAGADLVLPKPLDIPKLMQLIEFIELNGPMSQYPSCMLADSRGLLHWVPRLDLDPVHNCK